MILISPIHFMWITALFCILFYTTKNETGRYFLMVKFGLIAFIIGVHLDRGQEYEIKLINQKKVEIKSFITGRKYYVAPEKITETIDKDNL